MHLTDEQPFLDAVFDRYADDRPRLVYADFLDDSGQPERAELVRVQLALARLTADDERRPALADRQAELLTNNRQAWTAGLTGLVDSVDFRRGVPDSVYVGAAAFLARGDDILRAVRVRRLTLRDAGPHLRELASSPLLARIRELDLCNCGLGHEELALLAKAPATANLQALDLGFNGIDDAGVELLARSPHLGNLRALALNDNDRITDAGARALAQAPAFAGLTALDVSGNDLGDGGLVALLSGRAFPRLSALRMSGNRIGDAGASALARSPVFARMLKAEREFTLRANVIGHAGAAALAAAPALARCAGLDLSHNYLGDPGVGAVLDSPHLG
ncbi:MAG: TIGR02996 domain-containing protein, partial [Gemmataceae bacterium]|nr:TIGR02996 domain-containing protein [Gemmataceae bacterium]